MQLTLEQAMALAVLQGDEVGALALADRLVDRATRGEKAPLSPTESDARIPFARGVDVWFWPEFRALLARLGVDVENERHVQGVEIRLRVDEAVKVTIARVATDEGPT